MLAPGVTGTGFARWAGEPTPTKVRKARVRSALLLLDRPMHAQVSLTLDRDWAAEAVEGQALRQITGGFPLAVEKQVVAIRPHDEVEQALALGRQQAGPDRQGARDIAGDQPLQETADVLARQADQGAIGEGGAKASRRHGT